MNLTVLALASCTNCYSRSLILLKQQVSHLLLSQNSLLVKTNKLKTKMEIQNKIFQEENEERLLDNVQVYRRTCIYKYQQQQKNIIKFNILI